MLIRHAFPPVLAAVLSGMVFSLWACTPAASVVSPQPTASPLNGAALELAVNLPQLIFSRSDGGTFTTADTRDGDYSLDHTAATYLVNSASQIQLAYPYGTAPDDIVSDLRRLVAATPVGPIVTGA